MAHRLTASAHQALLALPPALALRGAAFLPEGAVAKVARPQGFLVDFLAAEGRLAALTVHGQRFYKLARGEERVQVQDTDAGVLALHLTLGHLAAEIQALEAEVAGLQGRAKEALGSGSRVAARNHLMKRKRCEASLQRKFRQVANLEEVMEGIVGAETNRGVVEAYRAGLEAMRGVVGAHDVEEVEELMGEMGEVVGRGERLGMALASREDTLEGEELERELEQLVEEQGEVGRRGQEVGSGEEDLLARLEQLVVEEGALEPVILPTREVAGPVAL